MIYVEPTADKLLGAFYAFIGVLVVAAFVIGAVAAWSRGR